MSNPRQTKYEDQKCLQFTRSASYARLCRVLLIDDIDSGWTLTLAGWVLRKKGSGPVYPFTLARATARKT